MKHQPVATAGLLLLCLLTAFVSADSDPGKDKIQVMKLGGNKMELKCSDLKDVSWTMDDINVNSSTLEYEDRYSGEYKCSSTTETRTIYVKIRTCDNCVELDYSALVGLVIGDLVATAVIGVAVYLIASQAGRSVVTSPQKKSSDRQRLVPNEVTGRGAQHYEQLRHKAQRDTYDVINKR